MTDPTAAFEQRLLEGERTQAAIEHARSDHDERDDRGIGFSEARWLEVPSELGGERAQRIADGVVDAVERFRGGPARDDIAIKVLRVVRP